MLFSRHIVDILFIRKVGETIVFPINALFCIMIDLARHIETLLLENDCVILPDLGGFVAHYNAATYIEEEHTFLPPTRTIGFNPQLKMNDGVLVQSYMSVYGTNFSDATRMVNKKIQELIASLHETGKWYCPTSAKSVIPFTAPTISFHTTIR